MTTDKAKLAAAIRKAAEAAAEQCTIPDSGTCNFDFAYVRVPGMRDSSAAEIQEMAGVSLTLHTYRYHGRVLKLNIGQGQAARNTAMAEAAYRSLKEQGFDSGMYYAMD